MDDEFNLAERILCEDEACIGLVGSDGLCKVCGRPYTGPELLPNEEVKDPSVEKKQGNSEDTSDTAVEDNFDGDQPSVSDEERVLCPDDTCIGIIGPDGACGTCGRRA